VAVSLLGMSALQTINPARSKMLKVLSCVLETEGQAAANLLKRDLDKRGLDFEGIEIYSPFFKYRSEFDDVKRRVRNYWEGLGYLKRPEPEPVIVEQQEKDWRHNLDKCPGKNFIKVKGYSYERNGKTIVVKDYWRCRPNASRYVSVKGYTYERNGKTIVVEPFRRLRPQRRNQSNGTSED
jgi:hypothetical protein